MGKVSVQGIQQAKGLAASNKAGSPQYSNASNLFSLDLNSLIEKGKAENFCDLRDSKDDEGNIVDHHSSETPRKLFDSLPENEDDILRWPDTELQEGSRWPKHQTTFKKMEMILTYPAA